MTKEEIISFLPYSKPFLFVDSIERIDENSVTGTYKYNKDDFFYKGHFKNYPVTPGVILTETMAQIGLVCLGIFLLKDEIIPGSVPKFAMVSSNVEFLVPVFPEERVVVISKKMYFRFGKLKCDVQMQNRKGKIVCKGIISGMIYNKINE
jgi:3-hydroxyacyl-[acyl-carrier-protein] dehydratase